MTVGPDAGRDLGVPGRQLAGIAPDPANSPRALLDRKARGKVVAADRASADLAAIHTERTGHEFWVDAGAGFRPEEQADLVRFLLAFPGR